MATTTPDNIQYPVNSDQVAPLASHFKNLADSTQAALNTKPDTADLNTLVTALESIDYAKFDTTYVGGSTQPGMVAWNDVDGTLEFQLKGGNVTLQIGQEQVVRVRNNTGSQLDNGKAVYISGSDGNNLRVAYANAGSESTSSGTIGVLTEDLGNGNAGYVTTFGLVRNINTITLTEGAPVWLSTTNGVLTSTRPTAPNHSVMVGFCLRSHAVNGSIFVRVDNGWELDELHNVLISSPQNKQVLAYEDGLWKNKQATGGVTVGATAPAGPNPGDAWYNSNNGMLYVWYVDADSTAQWVQVKANSGLEASILSRLGGLESQAIAYGTQSPNHLINGGMDIWQRGNSIVTTGPAYAADRFWVYTNGGTTTFAKEASVLPSSIPSAMKVSQASAIASNVIYQFMESSNAGLLAGKTVTMSVYLAATAALSVTPELRWSSTTDAGVSASWNIITPSVSSWSVPNGSLYARYTATFAVPTSAISICWGIIVNNIPIGASYYVTGAQLEVGSTATAFRRNQPNIQAELAACQRYFIRIIDPSGTGVATGTTLNGASRVTVALPVEMRAKPSGSGTGTFSFWDGQNASNGTFSPASYYASRVAVECEFNLNAGFTVGRAIKMYTNNTNGVLDLSAEL